MYGKYAAAVNKLIKPLLKAAKQKAAIARCFNCLQNLVSNLGIACRAFGKMQWQTTVSCIVHCRHDRDKT